MLNAAERFALSLISSISNQQSAISNSSSDF